MQFNYFLQQYNKSTYEFKSSVEVYPIDVNPIKVYPIGAYLIGKGVVEVSGCHQNFCSNNKLCVDVVDATRHPIL